MRLAGLAAGGWLVLLTMVSCAATKPISVPVVSADPAVVLAVVRQHEAQIHTLRARFAADTQRGDEKHSADGVLLVMKPDRFRLRLMLPLGLTVFDYVSWGEHAQMSLPFENRVVSDPVADNHLAFTNEDLAQAFLRGVKAFPGTCTPSRDEPAVVVLCRDGAGNILRRMRIDPRNATPLDETSYQAGQPRLIIRYSDYRTVDDALLPFHIAMRYPEQNVSMDIAIQRYEVNPRLADALFQPLVPWGGS